MYKKVMCVIVLTAIFGAATFASVMNYTGGQLDAANNLSSQGIINNHKADPENYNLTDNVLRQEIAVVARGVAKLDKKTTCDEIFDDVTAVNPNNWACYSIEPLVDNDLISKNKLFEPERNISKSEAIAMLIKAIGFDYLYDENNKDGWQKQVVDYAASKGVVDNFTDYDTEATRGWVFEVADITIKKDIEIKRKANPEMYSDEAF